MRYIVRVREKHKGFPDWWPDQPFAPGSFGTGLRKAVEFARSTVKESAPHLMLQAEVIEAAGKKETIKYRCRIDEHGQFVEDRVV